MVFRELVFCCCSFYILLKKILSGGSQVDQEDPRSLRLSNRWRESSLGGGNLKEGKVCLFPDGGRDVNVGSGVVGGSNDVGCGDAVGCGDDTVWWW